MEIYALVRADMTQLETIGCAPRVHPVETHI